MASLQTSRSEYARLDAPVPLKLDLPALLQKENAPALPKVGRDADERNQGTCNASP